MNTENKYYIYFILDESNNMVKIGRASNPAHRLAQLQVGNPNDLTILGVSTVGREEAKKAEDALHGKFRRRRVNGEWFECTPYMKDLIEWMNGKKADSMFYFEKDWLPNEVEELTHKIVMYMQEQCVYGNDTVLEELCFDLKNILDRGHK